MWSQPVAASRHNEPSWLSAEQLLPGHELSGLLGADGRRHSAACHHTHSTVPDVADHATHNCLPEYP